MTVFFSVIDYARGGSSFRTKADDLSGGRGDELRPLSRTRIAARATAAGTVLRYGKVDKGFVRMVTDGLDDLQPTMD